MERALNTPPRLLPDAIGNFRLDGRRAIITGGASGIGNAIARAFHSAGATITILDLIAEAAQTAAASLSARGQSEATGIACDVADEASVAAAFTGPCDILVNSAGISHIGSVLTTAADDFDRLYRVNVRGTFLCMKAAAAHMQHGGVICNIASIAATTGLADRFAYSMTKGAVLSMTLSAARDLLSSGIRVNCISPARIHTPFVDNYLARTYPGRETEMFAELSRSQPIGRMGTPDEVALLALYLCSPAAAFLTGVDMPLDGGFFNLHG